MSYFVRAGTPGGLRLGEPDGAASALQNIRIILSTRRGSVPMYRQFGLPMRFVDMPAAAARQAMVAEVTEAIQEFEPRASVLGVTCEAEEGAPWRLVPVVEVDIINGQGS